ncbi:PriCT-2 domain-containing protein [Geminicoccus flavidas]|uniref:PriCT-2 domain-containing protein n=1 Tax=Geminicoccus flavidas TaxID=2506407 RepID=UPI001359BFB7|nr:PriCT-2 domain-containing protein [Geminicoccus flavidas]
MEKAAHPGGDGAAFEEELDAENNSDTATEREVSQALLRNFMREVGPRLVDQGYRVVPLPPGKKFPGEYAAGIWRPMRGWMRFADREPTDLEFRYWCERWPGTGAGIICKNVFALDLDLHDMEMVETAKQRAFRMLGDTTAIRVGQAPKCLLVYGCDEPIRPIKRHPIEGLGVGNQFCAYHVHPGTGRPYAWILDDLVEIHRDDLPRITEEQARASIEAIFQELPDESRPSTLGDGIGGAGSAEGLRGDPEAVAKAMAFIKNNDLPYDQWIGIGYSLKGSLGDDGWPLFRDFSAQSAKHNTKCDTWVIWRSLKPHSKGAGSIYHLAMQAGWQPPSGLHFNEGKRAAAGAAAGLIRNLRRGAGRKATPSCRTVRTREEAESVLRALETISPAGRTYPEWNSVCRAIHAAFGERGRAIWMEWAGASSFGDPGRHFDLISKGGALSNWNQLLRLARELNEENAHG